MGLFLVAEEFKRTPQDCDIFARPIIIRTK